MSKLTLVLDSTQIAAADSCMQYWDYSHRQHIVPTEYKPSIALDAGSYGHKLLELYYTAIKNGSPVQDATAIALDYNPATFCVCGHDLRDHDQTVSACTKCRCPEYRQAPPDVLDIATRELVRTRFREYTYVYLTDIRPHIVEQGFSYKLYESDTRLYVLEGRVDLLGEHPMWPGKKAFLDHKFQMRRSNLYKKSIQFRNYALATDCHLGIINYIRLAKETSKDTYVRELSLFSESEILVWRQELIGIYNRIANELLLFSARGAFSRSRSSCPGKYGHECPYTMLCDEIEPILRLVKIQTMYKTREEWRPW